MGKKIYLERQSKLGIEKKQIIKCLVWSIAVYAAETWMLMLADRPTSKLEAYEMWIWRMMENISWKDKKKIRKFYTWSKKTEKF